MEKNKELEIALTTYIALKHSQEECTGFIDGFKEAQALQLQRNCKAIGCVDPDNSGQCIYCGKILDND